MNERPQWLKWAIELQALAQAGLEYGHDKFDLERYERIRDIAAEIMARHTDLPMDKVRDLFCNESGYHTPKLETRAAIFQGEKILLVQESDGLWALPGGWADVDITVGENTVKEVREEAGLEVTADLVIALQDQHRHNRPVNAPSSPIWRRWTAAGLPWMSCPLWPRAKLPRSRSDCALTPTTRSTGPPCWTDWPGRPRASRFF